MNCFSKCLTICIHLFTKLCAKSNSSIFGQWKLFVLNNKILVHKKILVNNVLNICTQKNKHNFQFMNCIFMIIFTCTCLKLIYWFHKSFVVIDIPKLSQSLEVFSTSSYLIDELVVPTRKKGKGKKVVFNQTTNCNTQI